MSINILDRLPHSAVISTWETQFSDSHVSPVARGRPHFGLSQYHTKQLEIWKQKFIEGCTHKTLKLLKKFGTLLNVLCFHRTSLTAYYIQPHSRLFPLVPWAPRGLAMSSSCRHRQYLSLILASRRVADSECVLNKCLLTLTENCLMHWRHRRQCLMPAAVTEPEELTLLMLTMWSAGWHPAWT